MLVLDVTSVPLLMRNLPLSFSIYKPYFMKIEKSGFSEPYFSFIKISNVTFHNTLVSILWTYIQGSSIKISLWNSSCYCVKCQYWYMRCRQPQQTCISYITLCYMFRPCGPADGTHQRTKQSPLIFKIFCTIAPELVYWRIIFLPIARTWQPVSRRRLLQIVCQPCAF